MKLPFNVHEAPKKPMMSNRIPRARSAIPKKNLSRMLSFRKNHVTLYDWEMQEKLPIRMLTFANRHLQVTSMYFWRSLNFCVCSCFLLVPSYQLNNRNNLKMMVFESLDANLLQFSPIVSSKYNNSSGDFVMRDW